MQCARERQPDLVSGSPYTAAMAQTYRTGFALPAGLLALLACAPGGAAQLPDDAAAEFRRCAALESPDVRLACFDALAARNDVPVAVAENDGILDADPAAGPSRVSRRWELEDITQRGRFALVVHKPNYFLAGTWNFSPNQKPFDTGALRVRNEEVKLQLSFKVKLAEEIFGANGDLWATYTQQSYWLAYAKSAPFRDTSYEPSLLFTWRSNFDFFGARARLFAIELNHSSNGRGDFGELSRSWNRIIGKAVFEKGEFIAEARAWWRIPEPSSTDNNPDIEHYLGNSEVLLSWQRGTHTLSAQVRSNLSPGAHRGAAEFSWSFPLARSDNLKAYLQYFYGYGESLIDYNVKTNRIGVGFAFSDWY
jgi:phospholipase A1